MDSHGRAWTNTDRYIFPLKSSYASLRPPPGDQNGRLQPGGGLFVVWE
jgi:hypothetical protein